MLARALLFLVFLAMLAGAYWAGDHWAEPDDAAARVETGWHVPLQQPDRIVLTWAGDPATTQAVTWRTSVEVASGVGQIAVSEDGPDFRDKYRSVDATTERLDTDQGAAHYHSVRFTGLEPDTMYVYRVGDGDEENGVWSEWNQFRTPKSETSPLTFLYVGDAQNELYSFWSRLVRQSYLSAPDAAFYIHAGDLVNTANRDAEWGEWLKASGWIHRMLTAVPTPGNHEYAKQETGPRTLSEQWRPQFTLPENGPDGTAETAYWFDVQGVRVVVLNSNREQEAQAEWLHEVLADNPNRWTVITHHHPIFSASEGRDNPELRALWQPIYDQYGVDLVMTGHDHTYARSNLVSGESVQEGPAGTVYVVSVSGPKMYEVDREDWMVRAAERTQLFQVVTIDGDELLFSSYTARGELYDRFRLRKRPGEPNELINEIPETPERLP